MPIIQKRPVYINLILISILIWSGLSMASAQTRQKKDTIYYLLDTLKTPANDRMIKTEVENEGEGKYITIKWRCLKEGEMPSFRYNIYNGKPLKRKLFKSLKLLSLVELIELAHTNSSYQFATKYILYIVEPNRRNFIKYKASFIDGTSTVSYDIITVPPKTN